MVAKYTEARKKDLVCIYVHLFIAIFCIFNEEIVSLDDIKYLIDLPFSTIVLLVLKSHDYKVIINA